jgi:demethylmenaquinone methyltransferase/2-methoxy-6-polyprenyl-1,4-benzoquinol methylase
MDMRETAGGVTVGELSRHARELFEGLPRTYDRMARVLSFGQDARWRGHLVSRLAVGPGALVLDVATGTGAVATEVARRTGAAVVGLDQSEPMLRESVRRVAGAGLASRIRLVLGHGERLPFPDKAFDALTFTYLLRYVEDPGGTLRELARVLKPGGVLANLEFHVPTARVWRGLWLLYTRVGLPLIGRAVSPAWGAVGRFLGPSIRSFYRRCPLRDQLLLWKAAGVEDVHARVMSLGGGVVIWGTKDGR